MWGATRSILCKVWAKTFQSTLPVWGATQDRRAPGQRERISIHAPRVGSDAIGPCSGCTTARFQSTLPVWGATGRSFVESFKVLFQSTLPVWGATPSLRTGQALRARFQSTLPVWGATYPSGCWRCCGCISIHAPRVGSDPAYGHRPPKKEISIHAPRVGSDHRPTRKRHRRQNFNPRSPCGERRCPAGTFPSLPRISIHAPRVGSDPLTTLGISMAAKISIHAPRVGSDLLQLIKSSSLEKFQSTLPVWGATFHTSREDVALLFQSTLPVWGATADMHKYTSTSL